jgi:hypothetical protein
VGEEAIPVKDLNPRKAPQWTWEDSPEGYPQTPPYKWWNWHDNYDAEASADPKWVEDAAPLNRGAHLASRPPGKSALSARS